MEKKILFALDFDISLCTAYRFLERFAKLTKIDDVTFFLSQYILELGLLDSKMSQFNQSLQAVAAIYTAKKYLQIQNPSSQESLNISDLNVSFPIEQVKSCGKCFHQLATLIQKSALQNVVKKYKSSKYFEVARILQSGYHKRQTTVQPLPDQNRSGVVTRDAPRTTGTANSSQTK